MKPSRRSPFHLADPHAPTNTICTRAAPRRHLNDGRMDLFFLLLAALMVANLMMYLWVAAHYVYKDMEHKPHVKLPPHLVRAPR